MSKISVCHNPGQIDGLAIITPTVYSDARGSFIETWNHREMKDAGLDLEFVQDNQSISGRGVLRGLHYQKNHPQGKLVRVISGAVYDVAVDLRKGSPTYAKYYGLVLDDKSHKQFYIPQGFAHGFLTLSDIAIFAYKVTDYWRPDDEGGLAWDDDDIAIEWPLGMLGSTGVILSDKDRANPTLKSSAYRQSR